MKCISAVKILLAILLILVKVTGIHPIRFDTSAKKFMLSWPEFAYTLVITGIYVTAYSSLVEIYLGNMKDQYRQGLVDLFLFNFCRLLNISIVVFYATQVYNRHNLTRFVNEMYEHFSNLFERLPQNIDYRVVLAGVLFRLVTISGTYCLTVTQPMSLMKSSELFDVLLVCATLSPYFIGSTLGLTYMAAAMMLKHGYERIGRRLEWIGTEVKLTNRRQFVDARRLSFIVAYGNLTDELAGLLDLYIKQNELLKLLMRLCTNNIFFTTTTLYLSPLVVTYMQFVLALSSAKSKVPVDWTVILGPMLNLAMLIDLVTIVKVFDQLAEAGKGVGKILHNRQVIGFDERLDREAEIFSMFALQDEPEVTIYSMYKLDNPLLYGMLATGISYLIILIQFFLENNK